MATPLVLVVDDEPDLVELVTPHAVAHAARDAIGRRRGQRPQAAQGAALRSVPHRHAPAGRRRTRPARVDVDPLPGRALRGDHCAWQRRIRRAGAQARRLRFRLQAARPWSAAPHRLNRAQALPRQRCRRVHAHRDATHRRRPVDGPVARNDHARGAQPGAGAYLGRIRHRQGTGGAHDSRLGAARRRPLRAGELRRHSVRAHGKRILRPQARQFHRRRGRQGRPVRDRPRAARCSSTKWRTCRCTCR